MSVNFVKQFILTIFAGFSVYSESSEGLNLEITDFNCPEKIEADFNQQLTTPVKGWSPFIDKVNTSFNLKAVSFYFGPPEGLAMIAPSENSNKHQKFLFGSPSKVQIWQVCAYTNSLVKLSRQLLSQIKSCSVQLKPTLKIDGQSPIAKIECSTKK